MVEFDRCIKVAHQSHIYMVREKSKSKVRFNTWESYVEAGKPPYDVVSEEEASSYRTVGYFRRKRMS